MSTHPLCGRRSSALCLLVVALLPSMSSPAADNVWDNGSGDFNYNTTINWDNIVTPPNGLVPSAAYDEVAVISNGDAVYLSAQNGDDPAGLDLRNGSSLELQNGAILRVVASTLQPVARPGNVLTDGTSSLLVRSGAQLSATNQMSLGGMTRIEGPAANVATSQLDLLSSHQLELAITHSSSFAPIEVTGAANLAGSLHLDFQNFTPASGNSWVLLDAGTLAGDFSSVTSGSLPTGKGLDITTQMGGNGTQLVAAITNRLVLSVASSGTVRIRNADSSVSQTFDGYRILSSTGALNVSGWTSLDEANLLGWEEANAASNHLGELNLENSQVIGPGGFLNLGNAYVPPAEFGDAPQPLVFEYSTPAGQVRTGSVDLPANNLVLQVDPVSGQAQIVNQSGFNVSLQGYRVLSTAGSLNPGEWAPLAEQDGNWEAANPAANHVGELNLTSSTPLAGGDSPTTLSLGELFAGDTRDLVFEFSLAGGSSEGDYNDDGVVNLADYTVWRDHLGAPAGSLPHDNSNLPIGATQYSTWKSNFGSAGGSGPTGVFVGVVQYVTLTAGYSTLNSVTVPEPATGILAVMLLISGIGWQRKVCAHDWLNGGKR